MNDATKSWLYLLRHYRKEIEYVMHPEKTRGRVARLRREAAALLRQAEQYERKQEERERRAAEYRQRVVVLVTAIRLALQSPNEAPKNVLNQARRALERSGYATSENIDRISP